MNRDVLHYELPDELIAQAPLGDRSASRLLVLDRATGQTAHWNFRDVVDLLQPGDLLVMNDTRVTARRLLGRRSTGGQVEALVLGKAPHGHVALTRPAKKLRIGDVLTFEDGLTATVQDDLGGGRKVLTFEGAAEAALARAGSVPLPPYIHGPLRDEERYQTVYARTPGSAAAPTAGLHFTPGILQQLRDKGVETATVTLDVGLDTFRPITTDDPLDHEMHGERCSVPDETARLVATCPGRIVAVGTTTVRTLESLSTGPRLVTPGSTETRLFITPGYRFQTVDGMFTNFHLPQTTMLLMIAALASPESVKAAYHEAVERRYRFLSFGDSMLIL